MTTKRERIGISNVSFHHPRYGGRVHRINWDKLGFTLCGKRFAWIPDGVKVRPGSLVTFEDWGITLATLNCRACKVAERKEAEG